MKKLVSILLVFAVMLTLGLSAVASESDELLILSELSDEELLFFLAENGVEIPSDFHSDEECIAFVRQTVRAAEKNSNVQFFYGFKYLQNFSDAIIEAVNNYYNCYRMARLSVDLVDGLQDNEAIDSWDEAYTVNNCYGYALGIEEWLEPGQVEWEIEDGEGNYARPLYNTVEIAAELVLADLEALGYTVTYYGTRMVAPLGGITEHERLICVRMAAAPSWDYHFMVYEADGYWYHKPGASVPLRYLHTPSSSVPWVQEGLNENGYSRNEDVQYVGTIYYFNYTMCQEADFHKRPCGNGMHIETCEGCGATRGQTEACTYRYKYSSNDKHVQECTVCGGTKAKPAPCTYVNRKCTYCGHTQISGSIIQSVCVQDNQ